jgi:hypothetical protein
MRGAHDGVARPDPNVSQHVRRRSVSVVWRRRRVGKGVFRHAEVGCELRELREQRRLREVLRCVSIFVSIFSISFPILLLITLRHIPSRPAQKPLKSYNPLPPPLIIVRAPHFDGDRAPPPNSVDEVRSRRPARESGPAGVRVSV